MTRLGGSDWQFGFVPAQINVDAWTHSNFGFPVFPSFVSTL